MKDQLRKRLRYLWTFELLNALLIFPLVYSLAGRVWRLGRFSLSALLVVCAILITGAAFWYLKLQAVDGSTLLHQPRTRRFFAATKHLFRIMLVALAAIFVYRTFVPGNVSLAELVVGSALSIMATLEYVNYYHIQLSYDNRADLQYLLRHRRLKQAVMVRDLDI